jgi:hypothetical protein
METLMISEILRSGREVATLQYSLPPRQTLGFEQEGEVSKLCCRSNKEILEKTKPFKEEKGKKLEDVKQSAEGVEEKRILRNR